MTLKRNLKGLRVAVLGLGRTGAACSAFLAEKGAKVLVSDSGSGAGTENLFKGRAPRGAEFFFGSECLLPLESADLAVASPGVPIRSGQIQAAIRNKIEVVGEIELFSWFCESQIIAVTGTNGKTTTAVLISKLFNEMGYDTVPAGNIGLPVTELPPGRYDGGMPVVCEISSFQLEHVSSFRPFVSIVLNVTPDHLDRHADFDEYVRAKRSLVVNQTEGDYAVLNWDCPVARGFARATSAHILRLSIREPAGDGVWIDSGKIKGRLQKKRIEIDAGCAGLTNIYNCMAAAACALIYGAESDVLAGTLKSFAGLEHRREFVTEISGVDFYNDSKATNAEAFLDALKSVEGRGAVIISGGRDKGIDYSGLRREVRKKVEKMVLIGETAEKLSECFKDVAVCVKAENMRDAVKMAFEGAAPGSRILLVPGTSSFDMFKDYEERGRIFKAEVRNLKKEISVNSRQRALG